MVYMFQTCLEEMNEDFKIVLSWKTDYRHVLSIMDQKPFGSLDRPNRGHLSALLGTEALRPPGDGRSGDRGDRGGPGEELRIRGGEGGVEPESWENCGIPGRRMVCFCKSLGFFLEGLGQRGS